MAGATSRFAIYGKKFIVEKYSANGGLTVANGVSHAIVFGDIGGDHLHGVILGVVDVNLTLKGFVYCGV
jgi:hypothetical protein